MVDPMMQARELLRRHFGYHQFRPDQHRVLRSVFQGRDTLAVLPTGAGKSVCFQIPAVVLGGLTVVVSPLISLMQDQVTAACARGLPAARLDSSLSESERVEVWAALRRDVLRLLYVSPERLERLAPELAAAAVKPRMLAVDEAHCITEWGHDFRPSYRTLLSARRRLGRPQVLALTGSATPPVRDDIARALGMNPRAFAVHLGSFDRRNLWFGVVPVADEGQRLRALRELLDSGDRVAIVYTPTRTVSESVARTLVEAGYRAAPYHAGLTKSRRAATLEDFLRHRLEVVVATCAFGMGIDKPDVRLVVHWMLPPSPEAYYQEAGRAGRDGAAARCVLLSRRGDAGLHRRQLDVTFPPRRLVERLWADPGLPGVPRNVRDSAERLRRELRPERGAVDWRVVEERRRGAGERIAAMEAYATARCRRRALVGYFGERLRRCAGCDACRSPAPALAVDRVVRERFERLQEALHERRAPWGGSLLAAETMLRLAHRPPGDATELASVPGVGAVLAERFGLAILAALGVRVGTARGTPDLNLPVPLVEWRRRTAEALAVPEFAVLSDQALHSLARARPRDAAALARTGMVGPRALAKFGTQLLELFIDSPGTARRGGLNESG